MSEPSKNMPSSESIVIDLRNPWIAGILAWLWPGAGHLYQGRYGKGLLFMGCVLSIFVMGLILGQGRVVYAMNEPGQVAVVPRGGLNGTLARLAALAPLPYWLQAGVGLPAMPALVQRWQAQRFQQPIFGEFMAPPRAGELRIWQRELAQRYDMGVLYTMIAGILNFFAIWDACAGPALSEPSDNKKKDDEKKPVKDKVPVTV
jgi:TM2 domain-containing membrane protein YozV